MRTWINAKKIASLRYGAASPSSPTLDAQPFDVRTAMIRIFARLQRKEVVILNDRPRLCGAVLAASDTKGTFLEQLIATPAWHPIYSIESMDGPRWEQLAQDFKIVLARLEWRTRLEPLIQKHTDPWVRKTSVRKRRGASGGRARQAHVIDAEAIARWTVRILFELLFAQPINAEDETLFYQASLEWRKEIAVKGKADTAIKEQFWARLTELVAGSDFRDGLESYRADPSSWLSIFAQPFLISPQINIGDIFVTVFDQLRAEPARLAQARRWARARDRARLGGVVLEAIRLRHPFPILERELKQDLTAHGEHLRAGTQVFILLDQFKQDLHFDPERWLLPSVENPFSAIPFAAGPRMCFGKPIAMELMIALLETLLLRVPLAQVQPARGHLYSGRDNDAQPSLTETSYQLRTFARGLWQSYLIGRNRPPLAAQATAHDASAPTCPWTRLMRNL